MWDWLWLRIAVLGFGLVLAGRLAAAEPETLRAVRLQGRSYVALRDVARYYSLGADRSGARETASYAGAGGSLVAEAETSNVRLNGAIVWLNDPVVLADGRLWVSKTDVLKTLDPILRPSQFRSRPALHRVMLDPGHGGEDRGTRGRSGTPEKYWTLDLARRVERQLTAAGVQVFLTRRSDTFIDLSDRPAQARQRGAGLFVSLHFNAARTSGPCGIETFALTPAGEASTGRGAQSRASDTVAVEGNVNDEENVWLAFCIQRSLVRATGAADRGVRRARFQVLREARCPAVLVESGFISNWDEEARVRSTPYRDRLAKAIAEGILEYRRSRG